MRDILARAQWRVDLVMDYCIPARKDLLAIEHVHICSFDDIRKHHYSCQDVEQCEIHSKLTAQPDVERQQQWWGLLSPQGRDSTKHH